MTSSTSPSVPTDTPPLAAPQTAANAFTSPLHEGVHYLQRNELIRARQCFERAMLANPRDAVARNCLGIVARSERRLAEAMAQFHKAIELQPRFAEAHNNMGNAYRDAGSVAEAAGCYRRALEIKPEFAEAQNNLGVALLALEDVPGAIRCFEEAIRLAPAYAEAHNNLANAYRLSGDLIAAAASLATALGLKPASPEIHNNLANVLRETGQWESARQHYAQAVQLRPDFAEAHENLGTILLDLERAEEAIEAYERAGQLSRPSVESLVNLGNAYRLTGRNEHAREAYGRAAALVPADFWHRLRSESLCPPAFRSRAEMAHERERALRIWKELAAERDRLGPPSLDSRLAEPSFSWQFLDGDLRPLKEAYAAIFGKGWRSRTVKPAGRPRVGMVVTSGHEGIFLRSLAGVIRRLGLSRMELAIACPAASAPAIRRAVERDIELVSLPRDFRAAADAIRAAGCSVLYFWEIGTDATNYFLPLLRLAPVQCTSWGVQVTSGISAVDYYLSSELVEPEDAADHYSERLLLSPALLTYQSRPQLPYPAKSRSDFGFRDQQHLYVCAQQLGKFHPDFDDLIADILRSDWEGLFVTVCDRYQTTTEIVQARMRKAMPDVADRVVFLPRLGFEDYLQLLNIADVLLDPPHFGGVNSAYDALAIGQPIVTLPSEFHRGRYTAACLRQIGLSDTIASNAEDYVRVAASIACDRRLQADLRRYVQQANAALFEDTRAIREHERLFEMLLDKSAATG